MRFYLGIVIWLCPVHSIMAQLYCTVYRLVLHQSAMTSALSVWLGISLYRSTIPKKQLFDLSFYCHSCCVCPEICIVLCSTQPAMRACLSVARQHFNCSTRATRYSLNASTVYLLV